MTSGAGRILCIHNSVPCRIQNKYRTELIFNRGQPVIKLFHERNDGGDMLLEFAADNDLDICNTRFQQKDSRKWTWRSPNNRTKNMIDLILIRKRWKTVIWNCRTYQGADIASDHSWVMCRFRTRLKVNVSNRAQARLDMNALQDPDTKKAFQASLAATLESGAHAEDDKEEHAKFIHEALDNALKEVVPKVKRTKSPWISQETLSLADQKREARNKRDQSEESLHTYRQLCNKVRHSARGDKERWLREKCEDIEKKRIREQEP